MDNNKFVINNRFLVNSTLNLIKDLENGDETQLEHRLMSLLCLLSENKGNLVSREMLISKIWNDYGGAEDGLNQTISSLRKALKDSKKEIIETVPKKGYVLHADVSNDAVVEIKENSKRRDIKKYLITATLVVCLFAGYLLWKGQTKGIGNRNGEQKTSTVNPKADKMIETSFSNLNIPTEETYLNTITTTAPDGTKYRLVALGDKRPEFYVNNHLLPELRREKYSELMDKMLRKLWDRQKKYNDSICAIAP